jgi:hypothetical protein
VLRRGNFRKASGWSDAAAAIGLPGCTFTIYGAQETHSRRRPELAWPS